MDLTSYDHIIVCFSGGKDSSYCLANLLDRGAPRERLELWHHDIDGGPEEHGGRPFFDWPCTPGYCRKLAQDFGIPIYFSWRIGGFKQELLRDSTKTAPVMFETPEGLQQAGGVRGPEGTRRKFPAISANLQVRWCSAALKIDVGSIALNNQERFHGKRVLFITGERAAESPGRAKYLEFEPHRTHSGRKHVDHWRPALRVSTEEVWKLLERHRVNPHPAYRLGWGRLSCMTCIFGSPRQWASAAAVFPERIQRIIDYEREFRHTIRKGEPLDQLIAASSPYPGMAPEDIRAALSTTFEEPGILPPDQAWKLPAGAFGESAGPT